MCVGFVMYVCFDNMQYVYCHSSATLTEVFPSFFPSCKANSGVKLAKTGHGLHSSKLVVICVVLLLFVSFCVLSVCKCVLYCCHRVATQLQLTYISFMIYMIRALCAHHQEVELY